MKKAKRQAQDEMRPEYDFTGAHAVRGKYYQQMLKGYTTTVQHLDGTKEVTHFRPIEGSVVLDPDVRAYFPDVEAVNSTLRGLIALIPARRRARRRVSAGREA
jgi:hypothetical protein